MFVVQSYPLAVFLCVVTMLCWGSWANTQKLAGKEWRFQLFYWDYALGVYVLSLLLAFTLGSWGANGRSFSVDLAQAETRWLRSAFMGGIIFNLSNILLVAAIDYLSTHVGNPPMLAAGVGFVIVAIVLDAFAYGRLARGKSGASAKGILLSVTAGVLMGLFYKYVAQSMGRVESQGGVVVLEAGKLSPYTAVVVFSTGVVVSNFVWNSLIMLWPFTGTRVPFRDYFTKGSVRLHAVGILGGMIWGTGMAFSIIASTRAGAALSYGLGQGATLVGALWGVFVWKEFKGAPKGTSNLLAAMFVCYVAGLALLILSKS